MSKPNKHQVTIETEFVIKITAEEMVRELVMEIEGKKLDPDELKPEKKN
jgi:hypothetical protein